MTVVILISHNGSPMILVRVIRARQLINHLKGAKFDAEVTKCAQEGPASEIGGYVVVLGAVYRTFLGVFRCC